MNLESLLSLLSLSFGWVLKTTAAATILMVLVMVVLGVGGRALPPLWRYLLWLLVSVRLVMPLTPSSTFSVFNLEHSAAADLGGVVSGWDRGEVPIPLAAEDRLSAGSNLRELEPHGTQGKDSAGKTRYSGWGSFFWIGAPVIWLMSGLGYLLVVARQHRKLALHIRREQFVTDGRLLALLEDAKRTLNVRRQVRVVETSRVSTPALFGLVKPRLLLPPQLAATLDDAELRHVFLHEMVHIKQWDVLLNYLLIFAQALHWFNPAVWLALRRLRAEREFSCDARVLAILDVPLRPCYGKTLLKVCAFSPRLELVPHLVSIMHHKPQIHRRIVMITEFKRPSRFAAFPACFVILALGGLTFTGAAEKEVPAKPPEPSPSSSEKAPKPRISSVERLESELAGHEKEIRRHQDYMRALKEDLRIADFEQLGSKSSDYPAFENFRKIDGLRIEAQTEYQRLDTFYRHLTNLSRIELRKAMVTASPDTLLASLMERKATCEQQLAEAQEKYGPDHPEFKRTLKMLLQIDKQIEGRMDGILKGLEVRLESARAHAEGLAKQAEDQRREATKRSSELSRYADAQREMENLQLVRDRLNLRLLQLKADANAPYPYPMDSSRTRER